MCTKVLRRLALKTGALSECSRVQKNQTATTLAGFGCGWGCVLWRVGGRGATSEEAHHIRPSELAAQNSGLIGCAASPSTRPKVPSSTSSPPLGRSLRSNDSDFTATMRDLLVPEKTHTHAQVSGGASEDDEEEGDLWLAQRHAIPGTSYIGSSQRACGHTFWLFWLLPEKSQGEIIDGETRRLARHLAVERGS